MSRLFLRARPASDGDVDVAFTLIYPSLFPRVKCKEYRCWPAPEDQSVPSPAIGSRELTHYFHRPHAVEIPQRSIHNQLPKRACGQLQSSPDQAELGWGIHFEEAWHWRTIYFVLVILMLLGVLFGVIWTVIKRDIQSGFAITAASCALGPVLLGYIAVRDAF